MNDATPADETKQPTVNTSKDVPTDQGLLRDPFPQQREPRTSALDGETRSQDTSGGADAPLPRTEGLTPPPPRHRRGSRPPKQFQPPKAAATQNALHKKQVRERRCCASTHLSETCSHSLTVLARERRGGRQRDAVLVATKNTVTGQ